MINKNYKFEVVSLFAGAGGSSVGYTMAGGKVVAMNEIGENACRTYAVNFPETYIFKQNIRELSAEMILEKTKKRKGEIDILDGSPPCSAFSILGLLEKGWNKNKKYSNTEQADTENLFIEYIRILRGLMPKVFIAENVKGLTIGVSKGYFNEIMRGLQGSGYNVICRILDAQYLGAPQRRNRAIFVGIRNDLWKEGYKNRTHPQKLKNRIAIKDAFHGLVMTEQDKRDTDISKYKVYSMLKKLKPGETHKKHFTLHKASPFKVAHCLVAINSRRGIYSTYHWDNRAFTIGELKRIQTVPDNFILTGGYQQQAERLGHMVPPLMMMKIAENIHNVVLKNENS